MQALEFINNLIPSLKLNDPIGLALRWMEELRVASLPVVDHGTFLGLIDKDQLFQHYGSEDIIENSSVKYISSWVFFDRTLDEVFKIATENQSRLVAVLDRGKTFLGVVSLEDAVAAYADSLLVNPRGSELILSMDMKDYQLSEISRLVESENAKILNSLISLDPLDENKIKLRIKLDKSEPRYIKSTLERFGYRVIEHYREETAITNEEDRIGNLLRFLNI
jgi:predicted transcriptional regulator